MVLQKEHHVWSQNYVGTLTVTYKRSLSLSTPAEVTRFASSIASSYHETEIVKPTLSMQTKTPLYPPTQPEAS